MKTFIIAATILITLLMAAKTNNASIPSGDCYRTPQDIIELARKLGGR